MSAFTVDLRESYEFLEAINASSCFDEAALAKFHAMPVRQFAMLAKLYKHSSQSLQELAEVVNADKGKEPGVAEYKPPRLWGFHTACGKFNEDCQCFKKKAEAQPVVAKPESPVPMLGDKTTRCAVCAKFIEDCKCKRPLENPSASEPAQGMEIYKEISRLLMRAPRSHGDSDTSKMLWSTVTLVLLIAEDEAIKRSDTAVEKSISELLRVISRYYSI